MKVKCPFLHYPQYALRLILKDKLDIGQGGMTQPEIEIDYPKEEIKAILYHAVDPAGMTRAKCLYVNGKWENYSDEKLAQLTKPEPKPKPKPKPEPKPKPKPEPKLDDE